MRWETILIAAACAWLVGCRATPTQVASEPSVIATVNALAANDKPRTLYEDDEMRIIAVDYGPRGSHQAPGFYVFGRRGQKWIRIEKVSLKDAVLGRSPTLEECRAAGKQPPSIGWDFRSLAGQAYVEFPLTQNGVLFFPDKVEKDREQGCLVLRFNSRWQMAHVETVLFIRLDDLKQLLAAG
jgi:hypothetical protein